MSFNTFGHLFRVTTFGESMAPSAVCRWLPGRHPLTEADIQPYLDKRRRPVALHDATARARPGAHPLGVFNDEATCAQVTTGTRSGW